MNKVILSILVFALAFLSISCEKDIQEGNQKSISELTDLKSNELELLKNDLFKINQSITKESGGKIVYGKKPDWHTVVQSDCTGFIAGGKLGSFVLPGWGTLIGGGIGAGLLSYAAYSSPLIAYPSLNQKQLENYNVGLIKDVSFSSLQENIGITHNLFLTQVLKKERADNDLLFDDRIGNYLLNYKNDFSQKDAYSLSGQLEIMQLELNKVGPEKFVDSIVANCSAEVASTIKLFGDGLSETESFDDVVKLITEYKSYIEKSKVYTSAEKEELMGFLVVAKHSAHLWSTIM